MLSNDIKAAKFVINDTKRYVPVVTLSTHDNNAKLLQQLKSGFKRTTELEQITIKSITASAKLMFRFLN